MTKKQSGMVWAYEHAKATDIYGAYVSPSREKVRAFELIRRECVDNDGFGLCVPTAGCQFFSAAYQMVNPETGVLQMVYHTYANRYVFDM